MTIEDLVSQLIEAGAPPALAAGVVARAFVEGVNSARPPVADSRSKAAIRQARYRERHASQGVTERNDVTENVTERNDVTSVVAEQKEMLPTPLERKTPPRSKENPPKGGQKKGSRLPPDWQPSDEDLAYGRALGLSNRQSLGFAEDMRLWAASAPGQKGVKLDWSSTFRGWLRREAAKSRASPSPQRGNALVDLAYPELRTFHDDYDSSEHQTGQSTGRSDPRSGGFARDLPEQGREDSGGPLLDLRPSDAGWF